MKRIVVSAALILLIAGSLARDESWTTAGYAAMLHHMEQLELNAAHFSQATNEGDQ